MFIECLICMILFFPWNKALVLKLSRWISAKRAIAIPPSQTIHILLNNLIPPTNKSAPCPSRHGYVRALRVRHNGPQRVGDDHLRGLHHGALRAAQGLPGRESHLDLQVRPNILKTEQVLST